MVRVVGLVRTHILLCSSGGNLTRAHFHRRCLAAADCPSPRSLAAAHAALGAWLRASHTASGRAGMRRVGGRRRSSVSDRANASVVPAGEVTDEQAATRQVSRGWQRARAIAPARCGLRTVAPPPPVPRGRACTARIAPTCAVLPPPRQRGWALAGALTYVTAFWPAPGPLYPTRPFVSHESDQRTRVCHADAPAPLGSRERASRCCAHRWGGALAPNFCNG